MPRSATNWYLHEAPSDPSRGRWLHATKALVLIGDDVPHPPARWQPRPARLARRGDRNADQGRHRCLCGPGGSSSNHMRRVSTKDLARISGGFLTSRSISSVT